MKFNYVLSVLALAAMPANMALADHNEHNEHNQPGYPSYGGGGVARLAQEARQLESQVRYAGFSYDTQAKVSRFRSEADRLQSCSGPYAGGEHLDHNEHNNPGYPGANCSALLQQVRGAWSLVERELYDTSYDRPAVYQQYLRTRDALNAVYSAPTPTPYPPTPYPPYPPTPYPPTPYPPSPVGQWRAQGQMDGRFFTFTSPNRNQIAQQCRLFGRQQNIHYVAQLVVNGQAVYNGPNYHRTIQEACQIVKNQATRY